MINEQIQRICAVNVSQSSIFFNSDLSNVVNINSFVMLFVYFNKFESKFSRLVIIQAHRNNNNTDL